MKIDIRPAIESDIPILTELFNYYVENGYSTYKEAPVTEEYIKEQYQQYSSVGPYRMLVAEVEGKVVGKVSSSQYRVPKVFSKTVEFGIYLSPDV